MYWTDTSLHNRRYFFAVVRRATRGEGTLHMKGVGMLVGILELNS